MNIFKHEFKMNLRSVIIWSVALVFLIFVYMSIFSSLDGSLDMMNDMMTQFPPELLMAFGMTNIDFSSAIGFFGVIFLFAQIMLAIQASNYGFSLVSIEESELTADFLLAKPIGRTQIMTSKLLAAFVSLTITNAVVWISSIVVINIHKGDKPLDTNALLLLLASIVIFQLFFLTVGMVISLLVKRVRSVTPFSMALAFGMYVLGFFGSMLGEGTLDLITPFKHFEPNYILSNAKYDLPLVMISVVTIVISVVASYVLYNRRNIASAV